MAQNGICVPPPVSHHCAGAPRWHACSNWLQLCRPDSRPWHEELRVWTSNSAIEQHRPSAALGSVQYNTAHGRRCGYPPRQWRGVTLPVGAACRRWSAPRPLWAPRPVRPRGRASTDRAEPAAAPWQGTARGVPPTRPTRRPCRHRRRRPRTDAASDASGGGGRARRRRCRDRAVLLKWGRTLMAILGVVDPAFFCGTLLMSHQMMVFPAIYCAEVSGGHWREPFIVLLTKTGSATAASASLTAPCAVVTNRGWDTNAILGNVDPHSVTESACAGSHTQIFPTNLCG